MTHQFFKFGNIKRNIIPKSKVAFHRKFWFKKLKPRKKIRKFRLKTTTHTVFAISTANEDDVALPGYREPVFEKRGHPLAQ